MNNHVVTIALQSGIGVHRKCKKVTLFKEKKKFCFHINQLYFPLIKIKSPRVNLNPGVLSSLVGLFVRSKVGFPVSTQQGRAVPYSVQYTCF